jgi:hypothetical protein
MALDTFIAGRYNTTYNAVDVGITDQGYNLTMESKVETIEESDSFGNSIIDWIYRGGNCYIDFDCKSYKAGSTNPYWPYGALGAMGVIGRLASAIAVATVMTALTGTPAATAPATITTTLTLLAPNSPAKLLFNSKLRQVPVRLQVLPYDSGAGVIKWFV